MVEFLSFVARLRRESAISISLHTAAAFSELFCRPGQMAPDLTMHPLLNSFAWPQKSSQSPQKEATVMQIWIVFRSIISKICYGRKTWRARKHAQEMWKRLRVGEGEGAVCVISGGWMPTEKVAGRKRMNKHLYIPGLPKRRICVGGARMWVEGNWWKGGALRDHHIIIEG